MSHIVEGLRELVRGEVWLNEPMKYHTVFRIGGPATAFIQPADAEDVRAVTRFARENGTPLHAIGQGSNLLVSDEGIDGIVMKIGKPLGDVEIQGEEVRAGAGASLPTVAWKAAKRGLTGLEWGVGVPGSVGGAVVMNAGAHGGCMAPTIVDVTVIPVDGGDLEKLTPDQIGFSYRSSLFLRERHHVVIGARLRLSPGDPAQIEDTMRSNLERRRQTQPITQPGAGSIFKNPPGDFSGRLIEAAGLKGLRIGDAQVSPLHANFIVNVGKAKASDVLGLIREVQRRIDEQFGVKLIPEVQMLGRGMA